MSSGFEGSDEDRLSRLERLIARLPPNLDASYFTDANGWEVSCRLDGRREYRRRWEAVASAALPDQAVVTAGNLPRGVNWTDLHIVGVHVKISAGGSRVLGAIRGTGTTFDLGVSTTDLANLNTKAATFDVHVTLAERA